MAIVWFIVAAILVSCGGGDRTQSILNEGPPTEVTGVWGRNCALSSSSYDTTQVVFGNPTMDSTIRFHTDEKCSLPQYQMHLVGTYQLGNPHGEGKEIDFLTTSVEVTALSHEYVSSFNFLKLCGAEDWQMNEPKNCPEAAKPSYTIYKVDGRTGYFGKNTIYLNATSPQTRPDTLDMDTPFSKQ